MRSKISSLVLALVLSVSMAGVSYAAKCKGEVVSNDGKQIVINLKKKCKAKAGDNVTIKVKRAAAVEGC